MHQHYHRPVTGLDETKEKRLFAQAVARPRTVDCLVACGEVFESGPREPCYFPLGTSVAHQGRPHSPGDHHRRGHGALSDLTASHDGVLATPPVTTAAPSPPPIALAPAGRRRWPTPKELMHAPTLDLASFVIALAEELPGRWTSEHQRHTQYSDQFARAEHVWDMNLVAHAIAEHVLDQDAVLTRDDGMRLYVIARPRHGEEFLVGALAPVGIHPDAFRAVREPDGIAIPDDPAQAAADIATDLLPRYVMAFAQVHDNATRLIPSPPPELVVITMTGRDFHVTKPERADALQVLLDNGCVNDEGQNALVLPGGAAQSQAIQNAAAQLAQLGVGLTVQPSRTAPTLDTVPIAALPRTAPVARSR
ncbi:hypothetical protein RB200_23155 [Streptomyces sp. PmtG]